jgi:chromosome segregation ATPase
MMHTAGPLRFNDPATSDFIIAAEGKELHVHKSVLTSKSPFLKKFLTADPTCARINANNAKYPAMMTVLRSLYETPETGKEFGAYHYNADIIASIWEIAMHFQLPDIATVATARLLQLLDHGCTFRVLQATFKHASSSNAKALQRHIATAYLPPTLLPEQQGAWAIMCSAHPWLREASLAAEHAANDSRDETNALTMSAQKVRKDLARAQETLEDLKTELANASPSHQSSQDAPKPAVLDVKPQYAQPSPPRQPGREARKFKQRPKPQRHHTDGEVVKLRNQILDAKSQYTAEMAEWRARHDSIRAAGEENMRDELDIIETRIRNLRDEEHRMTEDLRSMTSAVAESESEAHSAEQFIRDGGLYAEAASLAYKELQAVMATLPPAGSTRALMRKALGAIAMDAKAARDQEGAALAVAKERRATVAEYLANEEHAVNRLRNTLRHHEDEDSQGIHGAMGSVFVT